MQYTKPFTEGPTLSRWIVIVPLLLTMWTFKSFGQDLTREQEAAVRSFGIEVEQFNQLKQYLIAKADLLAIPQLERINRRASKNLIQIIKNKIYFLNSRQSNAFVLTTKHEEIVNGELINHVFFTTELIRELYKHCEKDHAKFAMALVGVLAHEMGHPIEGVQDELISKGWNSYSQSQEVAADGDAMYLLRAVGLPEDSLYVASSLLMTEEEPEAVVSLMGSHPTNSLRLSLQRLGLTFGRRLLGLKVPVEFKMNKATWADVAALQALPPPGFVDLKLPVLPLGTLAEARDVITKLPFDAKLEFNHSLLILSERLNETKTELDPDFRKWLIGLILKVISVETPRINYLQYPSGSEKQMSFEHMHPRTVDELLAQASALNTETFKQEFRYAFLNRFGNNLLLVDLKPAPGPISGTRLLFSSHGLNSIATSILRSHYWFEVLKSKWLGAMDQLLENNAPPSLDFNNKIRYALADQSAARSAIQNLLAGLPALERLHAIKHFLQVNNSNSQEILNYFLAQFRRETLEPFLISKYPFSEQNERRDKLLAEAQKDPASLAEVVDFHFDHAELFMMADLARVLQMNSGRLSNDFGFVDWPTLFRLKGVAPNYETLSKRFILFMQSPEYAELAKYLSPLLEQEDKTEFAFDSVDAKERPLWWSKRVVDALLSKKDPAQGSWQKLIESRLYFIDRESFQARLPKKVKQKLFSEWLRDTLPVAYFEHESLQGKDLDHEKRIATNRLGELAAWYVDRANTKLNSDPLKDFSNWVVTPSASQIYVGLSRLISMNRASYVFRQTMTEHSKDINLQGDFEECSEKILADLVYSGWEAALSEEMRAIDNLDDLSAFINNVFVYPTKKPRINSAAYAELVNLALTKLKEVNINAADKITLVEKIITRGSSIEIDRYIKTELWPDLQKARLSPARLESWIHRVSTQKLKLELTRLFFQQQGYGKYASLQNASGIRDFLIDLARLLPNRSLGKDQFIEQLCWDLKINDLNLLRRISTGKSTADLHQTNPLVINLSSGLASHLSLSSRDERWDLIEYLINPGAADVPESSLRHLDTLKLEPDVLRDATVQMKTALQDIHALTGPEKIPTIEFLLTVRGRGGEPLIDERSLQDPRWYAALGFEPKSPSAKLLEDYLEVNPAYESSSVWAYLLARRSENLDLSPASMKDIFEVHNVVGKKLGQGVHTWRLLPNAQELRDLKDRGQPMTKLDIVEAAHEELGAELAAQIVDYEAAIDASSIKTITRVGLKDGRTAALETQSRYAEDQIRATYDSAMQFVRRLQQRGLISAEPFINNLLSGLHGQLARELDFTQEAAALVTAKPLFERIQMEMGSTSEGYQLIVPQPVAGFPVTRRLLITDYMSGVAFDRLQDERQLEVGPVLFGIYSRALILHGWIDSDRSVANQLIDPEKRTIAILDLAQTIQLRLDTKSFRSDDRTHLLNLLLSLQDNEKSDALEKSVAPLLTAESLSFWNTQAKAKFRADWQQRIFAGEDFVIPIEERLIALMMAIENSGVHMDPRFSVYALKGILTFLAEPYVDRANQIRVLGGIAQELIKSKKPVYAVKNLISRCADLLNGKR